jgi:hypothetical protein
MFEPIDEDGDMDMMWIPGRLENFLKNDVYVAAFKEGNEASKIIFKQLFGNSEYDLRASDTSSEGWLYFSAMCKEIEKQQLKYEVAVEAMKMLKQQAFSVMKSTHDQAILELSPDEYVYTDGRHWTDGIVKIVKAKTKTVKKNKKNKK